MPPANVLINATLGWAIRGPIIDRLATQGNPEAYTFAGRC